MDAQARQVVMAALADSGLAVATPDDRTLTTTLEGQHKQSLPVVIAVGERTLKVAARLCAAPDERHAAVYRSLLRRNLTSGPIHFALKDDDVVVVGQLPLIGLDHDAVEQLLGQLLSVADDAFNDVLRTGFATYLAHEQRWRASVGLPPNPVGDPYNQPTASPSPTISRGGAR